MGLPRLAAAATVAARRPRATKKEGRRLQRTAAQYAALRPAASILGRNLDHPGPRRAVIGGADVADGRELLSVGLVDLVRQVLAIQADRITVRRVRPDDASIVQPVVVLIHSRDL